jgi:hypothetical protein
MDSLSADELKNLIFSVFSPQEQDKRLAIIVDVPDEKVPDNIHWELRRKLASDWHKKLNSIKGELRFEQVSLLYYQNVHNNNADLPQTAFSYDGDPTNLTASTLLSNGESLEFDKLLSQTQIIIAPTQFSATAPLKLLAKKHSFRAATMPGFSSEMIPSLKLDYEEINRRVLEIKNLLDPAIALDIYFSTSNNDYYEIHFDLRHREAHASGGRFPDTGTAGNLPSGECYIVPYEGEKAEKSESAGILPVQFDNEIVLYEIEQNVVRKVISTGTKSEKEKKVLHEEPAYGNIAEIGFGVLKDFGVKPTGEILLDEKLGLHIAFGRSDHFGGNVGVDKFSKPENVVHIDRIYIPETQDKVKVNKIELMFEGEKKFTLMENGEYKIF